MSKGALRTIGLGLVLAGATTLVVAMFLPFLAPNTIFHSIDKNSLIQQGAAGEFIVLAFGIAASGAVSYRRRGKASGLAIILCAAAAYGIYWSVNNKNDLRTIYPYGADGNIDVSKPGTVMPLGVALYAAGAGVALAFIGSMMLLSSRQANAQRGARLVGARTEFRDCAKTMLAPAKIGEWIKQLTIAPPTGLLKSDTEACTKDPPKIKCFYCQYVQAAPLNQAKLQCRLCGTKLQRKPPLAEAWSSAAATDDVFERVDMWRSEDRGVLAGHSPRAQAAISAGLLIPNLAMEAIFGLYILPPIDDGFQQAAAWGLLTLVYSSYFVGVVRLVARNQQRRTEALKLAIAAAVVDTAYSWYSSSPNALDTPFMSRVVFTLLVVVYIAAWGVARRQHPSWVIGLAPAMVVAGVFRFGEDMRSNPDWFTLWASYEGAFAIGCLICWAFDIAGRRRDFKSG